MSALPLTIDTWFKFTATHAGRDKTYRLFQYGLKFVVYHLKQAEGYDKDFVKKLSKTSSTLSLSRKLFRIGKFVENYTAFVRALTDGKPVDVVKAVALVKALSGGLYLMHDSMQWLHESGAYKFESFDLKTIKDRRATFWLVMLTSGFVGNMFKLQKLAAQRKALKADADTSEAGKRIEAQKKLAKTDADEFTARLDVVKTCLDIWIPLNALKYVESTDGWLGVCGMVTSSIGMYSAWPKK